MWTLELDTKEVKHESVMGSEHLESSKAAEEKVARKHLQALLHAIHQCLTKGSANVPVFGLSNHLLLNLPTWPKRPPKAAKTLLLPSIQRCFNAGEEGRKGVEVIFMISMIFMIFMIFMIS